MLELNVGVDLFEPTFFAARVALGAAKTFQLQVSLIKAYISAPAF
jgi:hypothetical protein